MESANYAGERLLDCWLKLTSTLWNTRLVSSMTFNEAHILGILAASEETGLRVTATDLIARTQLLKSQMNRILTQLEKAGFILRSRDEEDKRRIIIALTPAGEEAYRAQHGEIEAILQKLVERLGEERTLTAVREINNITEIIAEVLKSR